MQKKTYIKVNFCHESVLVVTSSVPPFKCLPNQRLYKVLLKSHVQAGYNGPVLASRDSSHQTQKIDTSLYGLLVYLYANTVFHTRFGAKH